MHYIFVKRNRHNARHKDEKLTVGVAERRDERDNHMNRQIERQTQDEAVQKNTKERNEDEVG